MDTIESNEAASSGSSYSVWRSMFGPSKNAFSLARLEIVRNGPSTRDEMRSSFSVHIWVQHCRISRLDVCACVGLLCESTGSQI